MDMLPIGVEYDPTTRRISLIDDFEHYGGASIDSDSVEIRVTGIPDEGYDARLDFAVSIRDPDHNVYRPFGPLVPVEGEDYWSYTLDTAVLMAARDLRRLPFQLVLTKGDVTINSRNAIVLQVTRAIDSVGTIVDVYRPAIMFLGSSWGWKSDVRYKEGSAVTYSGYVYVATQESLNKVPNENPEYWLTATGPQGDNVVMDIEGTELKFALEDYNGHELLGSERSVEFGFDDTTLNIDLKTAGQVTGSLSQNLEGNSLTAQFSQDGNSLEISSVNPRDSSQTPLASQWVRGDDLSADFNGTTTLHVYKTHNGGAPTEITSADLKGTFLAEWVNDNKSLQITDNSGVKSPVYIRGDDLSATFTGNDNTYLTITTNHNGSPLTSVSEWVQGDMLYPEFDGTVLNIYKSHKGRARELITSADLIGEPFRIKKTYPSVEAMNADFATCGLQLGEMVAIATSVEEPVNAQVYAKGESSWVFIVDMSGATGIRGPIGPQGNKGDSLGYGWGINGQSASTLDLWLVDYNNIEVPNSRTHTDLLGPQGNQGNSLDYTWGATGYSESTLDLWLKDYNGQEISGTRTHTDLLGPQGYKGDSLGFAWGVNGAPQSTLDMWLKDKDGVEIPNTRTQTPLLGPQGIQGDSITARFNDTDTLTIYSVDSQTHTETAIDSRNLKGPKGDGNSSTYKATVTVPANTSEVSIPNTPGTADFTWSLSQTENGRTVYKTAEISATSSDIYITVTPSSEARTFTFNYTAITGGS